MINYRFDIALALSERGVFENVSVQLVLHPSENEDFLLTRLLAYGLEYEDGLRFAGGGVSDAEAPAVYSRAGDGRFAAWIEVGAPSPARLRRGVSAAERLAVYCHKNIDLFLDGVRKAGLPRAEQIPIYQVDSALLARLAPRLERRNRLSLTQSGGTLYLELNGYSDQAELVEHRLA
jgi:uncharacterized protein YaeQ